MHTTTSIYRVPRYVVGLFFGFLLLLGGMLFRDYGISWDEPVDRLNGMVSLRYAAEHLAPSWAAHQDRLQNIPPLQDYHENDHGVLFELPLAFLDVVRPGTEPRTYYLLRHAAVFLVSLVGIWALFKLATLRFRDERLGLLAAGLLVLSPRFFGESFYNGKDLTFVALFTLSIYTLAWLLERPSWRRALVHGLATAAATDIRILGLVVVPFTFTLLILQFFSDTTPRTRRGLLQAGLAYLPALAVCVVAGWPYLWGSPMDHLQAAFDSMSHYKWEGAVLYGGNMVLATELPWHYPLVWMSITTPIAYQVAGVVGLLVVAAGLLRRPWATLSTPAGRLDFVVAGWLVAPVALVILFHSVIYDGWRHLYFVYPALLLLAVRGVVAVAQLGRLGAGWRWLALGLGVLAGGETLLTAIRMVRMHPQQQQYFSYLPRHQVEQQFERDYWGLSFREGLAYLVAHQPQGIIHISTTYPALFENNKLWLSATDQARLVLGGDDVPGRYYITSYRSSPGECPPSTGDEVFFIRADGVKILSIFQRTPNTPAPSAEPAPIW